MRGVVGNAGVVLIVLAVVIFINWFLRPRGFSRRGRGPGAMVILAVLLGLCNGVFAADAAPDGPFTWSGYAVSGRAWKVGNDRDVFVGSCIEASLEVPFGLAILGRVNTTTTQDGGAIENGDVNPDAFPVTEFVGGLYRPVVAGVGPMVAYGIAIPMEGGRSRILEDNPQRLFVGVMYRTPELWIAAGGGLDGAAGEGIKVQLGAQLHLKGDTYVGGDVSFPRAVARSVVLVRWGGSGR